MPKAILLAEDPGRRSAQVFLPDDHVILPAQVKNILHPFEFREFTHAGRNIRVMIIGLLRFFSNPPGQYSDHCSDSNRSKTDPFYYLSESFRP